eukprot:3382093-Pyramimonas_sp.AAC.1
MSMQGPDLFGPADDRRTAASPSGVIREKTQDTEGASLGSGFDRRHGHPSKVKQFPVRNPKQIRAVNGSSHRARRRNLQRLTAEGLLEALKLS